MPPPERIGLVRLGAIGDAVNVLPLVCRLRDGWPAARITWVIGPKAHAAVRGHRAVDEFLVCDVARPGNWPGIARELRARRFELTLDLQRILKSGILTRVSGAPRRVGFDRARCKEWSQLFATEHIAANAAPGVTVAQYLEFADHLGLPPSPLRWDLPRVPYAGGASGAPRAVVHVGATKSANRWAPERWAELVTRLVREGGLSVHLTGGPAERAAVDLVKRLAPVALVDECARLSLQETAGLIESARVFVGGDSGPLHMAVAVGTPVVALYGAADPARTGPHGGARWVVSNPVPCSPCRRRTCNVPGHPCMNGLEVERVLERVRERLATPA
jgi:ADP-heptose:LPS heptosyltransferase